MSSELSFSRLQLLVGEEALRRLQSARVILFGVGGVGSWCAESLVRSGISHLTIVDADNVDITNINRQLPATAETVGQPKVEVMHRRLSAINPEAEIEPIQCFYDATTADRFNFNDFDYVVDCIDSVAAKALLIRLATAASRPQLFSSMGAALKLDPSRVQVAEFWKVKGCPLARALRTIFKRSADFPRRRFRCVYSDEPPAVKPQKGVPNGTISYLPAIFGLTLSSLIIKHIISPNK